MSWFCAYFEHNVEVIVTNDFVELSVQWLPTLFSSLALLPSASRVSCILCTVSVRYLNSKTGSLTLTTVSWAAAEKWGVKDIAWLMVQIWFGNTYLSFAQAESFHPVFGPILMTCFAALSNTLLLTSTLLTFGALICHSYSRSPDLDTIEHFCAHRCCKQHAYLNLLFV